MSRRPVGRPPKNRVIESSSGSEKKTPTIGLRSKDLTQTTNEVVIFDDLPAQKHPIRERPGGKLVMSASSNAMTPASADTFAQPHSRGTMATRKRMRHEIEGSGTSNNKMSPSPSRPISDEQEAHVRVGEGRGLQETRQLRKRQKVE